MQKNGRSGRSGWRRAWSSGTCFLCMSRYMSVNTMETEGKDSERNAPAGRFLSWCTIGPGKIWGEEGGGGQRRVEEGRGGSG